MLSLASALAQLRDINPSEGRLSPSAPVKLMVALGCVLMVSLSRNSLFLLIVLAGVLVRACLLPRRTLARVMVTSLGAALLTLLIMLPSSLMGQTQSALTLALKSLTSVGVVMSVALSTPTHSITSALRLLHVPSTAILTANLALNGIVRLGETALEVLSALRLRSVGTNQHKQASMGGIGGVVLLKAGRAAQDTYDAMRCRGFDGTYRDGATRTRLGMADALWLALLCALVIAFVFTQRMV